MPAGRSDAGLLAMLGHRVNQLYERSAKFTGCMGTAAGCIKIAKESKLISWSIDQHITYAILLLNVLVVLALILCPCSICQPPV